MTYETFSDPAYFDMHCVCEVGENRFGYGWHLANGDEAQGLVETLNSITVQRDRLIAALTPSGDTKAAYMGEVYDKDFRNRPVSWTAIKEVMALVRKEGGL